MKKDFIYTSLHTLGALLILALLATLLWPEVFGAHPECGVNPDVGPCDYLGLVKFLLPNAIDLAIYLWLVFSVILLIGTGAYSIFKKRH